MFMCKLWNSFVLPFAFSARALGSSATIRNSHLIARVLNLRCLERDKASRTCPGLFSTAASCSLGYRKLQRTEIRMLGTFANEQVFDTSVEDRD